MVSILQVDGLGKRYGLLPSEVISRGNTFDLYIMDCALTFEHHQHKKAMNNNREPIPDFTTDELLKIKNQKKIV